MPSLWPRRVAVFREKRTGPLARNEGCGSGAPTACRAAPAAPNSRPVWINASRRDNLRVFIFLQYSNPHGEARHFWWPATRLFTDSLHTATAGGATLDASMKNHLASVIAGLLPVFS